MLKWAKKGQSNRNLAFVPRQLSGHHVTAHASWTSQLAGWHFYARPLEPITPERVVVLDAPAAPGSLFYDTLVTPADIVFGGPDARGTLFVVPRASVPENSPCARLVLGDGEYAFVAYAVVTQDGQLSVVASDWVHSVTYRPAAEQFVAAVCEHMGVALEPGGAVAAEHDAVQTDVLVGADPEFEIAVGDPLRVVQAGALLCDDERMERIGLDSTGLQMEIRPWPCRSGEELYESIVRLCEEAAGAHGIVPILSGNYYPLGCHIHIGPAREAEVANPEEFAHELDSLATPMGELGQLMLALCGEARGDYALRAAYEPKEHGGLEYRTPPSAILAFPETFTFVADAALALARGDCLPPFPQREFELLLELVKSRNDFTFGGKIVKPEPWLVLTRHHEWSAAWRNAVGPAPADARCYLFAFSEEVGDVTNHRGLAQALGLELIADGWYSGIGLPRRICLSDDEELIRRVIEIIIHG